MKKLICIILTVVMILSVGVVTASAQNVEEKQHLYKDKFIELSQFSEKDDNDSWARFTDYDELYYHINEQSGDTDWVLITVRVNMFNPWEVVDVMSVGDRLIRWWAPGVAVYSFGYVVYDVVNDKLYDIRGAKRANFDGLVEAFDELEIGCVRGDIDKDKVISVLDATEIQLYLSELKQWDYDDYSYIPALGDVDEDGDMTILDATSIQLKLAEIDNTPEINEEMLLNAVDDYKQPLETMPQDAVAVPFEMEYDKQQIVNCEYNYDVVGDRYTVAIIKSNEHYQTLFNEKAPVYDDEFFEDKWLVVALTRCGCLQTLAPITDITKFGDTLYVRANEYYPVVDDSPIVVSPVETMWMSMVSVDKELLADVNNIVKVK